MQILFRKCDACEIDIRSDSDLWGKLSRLITFDGREFDVCLSCLGKLINA